MDCRKWLLLSMTVTLGCAGCLTQREALRPAEPKEVTSSRASNLVQQAQQTQQPLPPAVLAPTKPPTGPKRLPKANTEVKFAEFQEREALSPRHNSLQREARLDKARRAYQRALEIDPENADAILGLARVYGHLRDYERAFTTYQKAMEMHPREPRLWYEMGMCYAQCKDFASAVSCYQKAVEFDPENRVYAKALGLCLARAGQPQEALKVLTRLYGEAKANLNVARMLHHINQPEQARAYLNDALLKDPGLAKSPQASTLMAELQVSAAPATANRNAASPVAQVSFESGKTSATQPTASISLP